MVERGGSDHSARGGAGRLIRFRQRNVWLFALLALTALGVFAGSSCSSASPGFSMLHDGPDGSASGGGSSGCIGATCPGACAANPQPGCACDVEGQHLICSKAEASFSDGVNVCGKGLSVCTGGVWGDCTLDGAVTIVPNAPPGFYADSLGSGTKCALNPCDPSCDDFIDTTVGLTFAGDAGIVLNDAGITLTGATNECVPKVCADLGKNCGPVSDTCGGLLSCGTCTAPATCGGAGVPSVCGVPVSCTNLCLKQVVCPASGTTSITGTVYAPNGTTPLPNAVVYVPNAAVSAFTAGVACVTASNCTETSGTPLLSTTTAVDGTFTLTNMPVTTNVPLVIQLGRFRRQLTIPNVAACVNTNTAHLSTSPTCRANAAACTTAAQCCSTSCTGGVCDPLTRLPKTHLEGDIPKMAFVTGEVDALECVWRKIGIADTEFTAPSGAGRINFFAGGYAPGTYIGSIGGSSTPWESTLLGTPATLDKYDMVLFPCQGTEYAYSTSVQSQYETNLANYANAGGRVFATHYTYTWIYKDNINFFSPLSSAINWSINQSDPSPDPQTGFINESSAKGLQLAQWLQLVGASTTLGQISINTLRHDFNSVASSSLLWMSLGNGTPMQVTYNTPIAAAPSAQCGRVVFSDFHVETATDTQVPFPGECAGGAFDPQELLLTNMLFDLAGCVTPDVAPPCTPQDCSSQGLDCGPAGDGCGNTINCGTCTAPTTCGGGGLPGVCGTPPSYSGATFVRDYNATSLCPQSSPPVWRLYSWSALTPSDSQIAFTLQTASTQAGLATAPSYPLRFSNPPGPAALLNQAAVAHAVNEPAGSPDTELGAASPNATLLAAAQPQNNAFLRMTAHLVPSSDKLHAPTLSSWDMQIDCQANQ
jgi:hypothetical protein